MAGNKVVISILADVKDAQNKLKILSRNFDDVGKSFSGLGKGILAPVAVVGGAIGLFSKAAADSQAVAAQTDAVIKSTGSSAGRTAKQIGDLATQVSQYSGFDDEAVQSGENMLLTFTNIKGVNFDATTKAAADLARATGTDLTKANLQLGKAINDPIKGVTALSRVGVTFTDAQKKQIATYEKLGQTAKAQQVILTEVNKEFGGSAKAYGDTAAGSIDKLKTSLGNVEESIGSAFLPILTKLGDKLSDLTNKILNSPGFQQFTTWLQDNAGLLLKVLLVVGSIGAAFLIFGKTMELISMVMKGFSTVMTIVNIVMDANPAVLITLAIIALIAVVVLLITHWQQVSAVMQAVGTWIATTFTAIWSGFVSWLKGLWNGVVGWFAGMWGKIQAGAVAIWTAILGFFNGLWGKVKIAFNAIVNGAVYLFQHWTLLGIITSHWGEILSFFSGLWGKAKSSFDKIVSGIGTVFGGVKAKVTGALSGAAQWLWSAGTNIVQGLIDGVRSMGDTLLRAILDLIPGPLRSAVESALGIHSPSRVFKQIGVYTVQGLIEGLDNVSGIKTAMGRVSNAVVNGYGASLNTSGSYGVRGAVVQQITVHANMLNPTPEAGRVIAQSIQDYQRQGGTVKLA